MINVEGVRDKFLTFAEKYKDMKKQDTKSWKQQHQAKWYSFLKGKGILDADAQRLAEFFTAQDGLESAGGQSSAARQKNNYGGMQRGGKNITYDSVDSYMEDKWNMMNRRFKPALAAKTIDEYATILGNPDTAGKGYLYYVTDKAKYNPNSEEWRAAQTQHMHNYINGMRTWAGQGRVKFEEPEIPIQHTAPVEVPNSTYVASAPIPAFIPSNPEAFFAAPNTYQQPVFPVAERPEPIPNPLYTEKALREEQRQRGLNALGLILSMNNQDGSNDGLLNTIGLLTKNSFDDGGWLTDNSHIILDWPMRISERKRVIDIAKRDGLFLQSKDSH